MRRFIVINGPNLNLLSKRNPEIYGSLTLEQVNQRITEYAKQKNILVEFYQSNIEGEIINKIHQSGDYDGIVFNPGAYTHTSIAIRDAIEATGAKVIEVHLSNIYCREPFRHKSIIAPVCLGQITGLGWYGYILAIDYLNTAGAENGV